MKWDTDESRVHREWTRTQRMRFCDAAVEWLRVGAGEEEAVAEVRRIFAQHKRRRFKDGTGGQG